MAPLLVITLVNVFSVRLFVRYLGPEMYALWAYVATFTGLFGFADLGLGVAVGRYIGVAMGKGDEAAVREYWGTGNIILLPLVGLMALAFCVLGVVLGPAMFNVAPANVPLMRACFVSGGLSLFVNYYGQLWLILSQAHLEFKFISVLRIGTSLLQILPTIYIAYLTRNPLLVNLWSLLTGALQMGIFIWHARHNYHLGLELAYASRARAREMAAFTGKSFAGLLIGSFFGSVDRLVLGKFAPQDGFDFTRYNVASNAGQRLQGLGVAVMGPVAYNTCRDIGAKGIESAAHVYNHTFDFTWGWYLLAAVWACLWHPVLLRLWLGNDLGLAVAPVFAPLIIAYCLAAMSNISVAQLGPLDRLGAGLFFNVANGLLVAVGVYAGWKLGGLVGVAYGFLFSRLAGLAQDLYVIRLIKGGGWLALKTWVAVAAQCIVGAAFATAYLVFPRTSLWLLVPAVIHGGLVSAWLSRDQLKRLAASLFSMRQLNVASTAPPAAKP
jgi:hypothetical protein